MSTLPLPDMSDPLVAPHWQAAAQGQMAMQRCDECGHVRWPAARSCPECLAEGGEWTQLSGRGTIWSYAVYETPLHPEFAELCPYAVALVQLAEGPMIAGRMLDPPAALDCGLAVVAVFESLAEGIGIARFRLVPRHAG